MRLLANSQALIVFIGKLSSLPPEIGQLSRLRMLDLSDNQLVSLPRELGQMPSLEWINVRGNPDLDIPDEVMEAGTQPILEYLREQ